MFAVQAGDQGEVIALHVMTLDAFTKKGYLETSDWHFIDSTAFYMDSEIADFMTDPQSYYVTPSGQLLKNYGSATNQVDFTQFADMGSITDPIPK